MPKHQKNSEFVGALFDTSMFESPPPPVVMTPPAPVAKPVKPTQIVADTANHFDQDLAMISALLDLDMGWDVVVALMTLEPISLEQYRYLAGPFSVAIAGTWEQDCGGESFAWLRQACRKSRLEMVFEELKTGQSTGLASPAEVLLCMYPATMVAPIHREWAEVYYWAFAQVLPRFKPLPLKPDGTPYANFWELAGMAEYPIEFERIKYYYNDIARGIRRNVVNAAKGRGYTLDRNRFKDPGTLDESHDQPTVPTLFDLEAS